MTDQRKHRPSYLGIRLRAGQERTVSAGGDPPTIRTAPRNIEAEQALLGAILINNGACDRVLSLLDPHHFYDPLQQLIYKTICKMVASGKRADPITLKPYFENAEPIDASLTVPQYLVRLAANTPTIINAHDYGRTIHDLATRRQLILIGEDMVNAAYEAPFDFPPQQQIEEAETRLFGLAQHSANERVEMSGAEAIGHAIARADEAHRRGDGLFGISTGFSEVDAVLGGLAPGNLMVVAGRPSMGKTGFAINVGLSAAEAGKRVYFASLEMSSDQIGERLLAIKLRIPMIHLRRGVGIADRMPDLLAERQRCANLPLMIDESSALTVAQLMTRVRRSHRKRPLDLVQIDYLQLLHGTSYRGSNRTQEVAEISGALKALAKELGVPVMALSQLNRGTET